MDTVKINPEIAKMLRKQTAAERQKLETLILRDGIQDPVVVWAETGEILDGHNRVDIASGNNADGEVLDYSTEAVSLPDLEAAIEYVLERQEGKRNATPQDLSYARGKLYERRKKAHGGARNPGGNNQHGEERSSPQNEDLTSSKKTGESVGAESGVSKATAERDAEYSRAVDALTEVFGKDFEAHVLSGESKLSKADVVMLSGELGKDDSLLYSAAELWAFGWIGSFNQAHLLARCYAECGADTWAALWSRDDGQGTRVRNSEPQLKHLLYLASKSNGDDVTADLVEIVESGQQIEDPATGKDRKITSVQDAHKLRQAERKKAEREKLEREAAENRSVTLTSGQGVVSCDALITDPPYGILGSQGHEWDAVDDIESFTREWASRWSECGADTICTFFSQRYLFDGKRWLDESLAGYEFQQLLIWHYPNNKSPQSRKGFKQTWEPIFFYRRVGADREVTPGEDAWGDDITDFDAHVGAVPQSNFNGQNAKGHPAQKPVSVMRWLIAAVTEPGETVCDPFTGSGTTGIAATQLGRKFTGVEIDESYLDLAKGRIAAYGA